VTIHDEMKKEVPVTDVNLQSRLSPEGMRKFKRKYVTVFGICHAGIRTGDKLGLERSTHHTERGRVCMCPRNVTSRYQDILFVF
jgi:hypothetical protein